MSTSHCTIRSGGEDLAFVRRLIAAAGFAAALFVAQTLPADAQGQRRQQQPPQQQQAQPEEAELEQIELTAAQVDAFIATENALKPITAKLKPNAEPSKQMIAQMEGVVKKSGFKDFDEYGNVASNIGFVFSGIDPQSKKYAPEQLIQREIEAVNADKKIPAAQKKKILQNLQMAAKSVPPLKYQANAELVAKNYDRLRPVMEGQ